jgi:hypothetical protein
MIVAVSLGNIYDSKRSGPGSWMLVGMIPAFSLKKARKAGRKSNGIGGCVRRRMEKFASLLWPVAALLECKDQLMAC